ncbi:hypothetical protein ACGFW5_21880 [Streptomyces sp. NPDC048416]|uniref:hypothetical protein n=1 Tax=Streptomyces sp. NPDC048416 TaxID=3365546 RepID=UPI00371F64B1
MRCNVTGPRLLAALALLPAALLAAGCGIQSTDVIAVGDPASAEAMPPSNDGTVLYFVGPDGLMPVVREGVPRSPLLLLFAGPDADERAAGLRTELPSGIGALKLSMDAGGMTVMIGHDVSGLTALAQRQIACTALRSAPPGRDRKVTIRGTGPAGPLGPVACTT